MKILWWADINFLRPAPSNSSNSPHSTRAHYSTRNVVGRLTNKTETTTVVTKLIAEWLIGSGMCLVPFLFPIHLHTYFSPIDSGAAAAITRSVEQCGSCVWTSHLRPIVGSFHSHYSYICIHCHTAQYSCHWRVEFVSRNWLRRRSIRFSHHCTSPRLQHTVCPCYIVDCGLLWSEWVWRGQTLLASGADTMMISVKSRWMAQQVRSRGFGGQKSESTS